MQSSLRGDWVTTVVQGVPKLSALSRHMRPTLQLDSIASLNAATLRSFGAHCLIWDVDGTLMRRHGNEVAPQLVESFQRLLDDPALRHVVLSNCDETRFVELATIFPTIPIIRVYQTDRGIVVRRRLGASDSSIFGVGVSLDPGCTVLRKPNVSMVRAALDELGCASAADAVMIGDQYLTDIAPANMAGVRSVKVRTVEPGSFPAAVRALQLAEKLLFAIAS